MAEDHKRRTGEEIAAILKRHLIDGEELSKVCEETGIHPSQFYRWQKILFASAPEVFEGRGGRRSKGDEAVRDQVARLEEKLRRKDEVLGELMEEHVRLKKTLGEP